VHIIARLDEGATNASTYVQGDSLVAWDTQRIEDSVSDCPILNDHTQKTRNVAIADKPRDALVQCNGVADP